MTARRPHDGAAAAAYLSNYKAELESVKVWERVVSSLKSLAVYVVRCIVIEYYGPVVVAIMPRTLVPLVSLSAVSPCNSLYIVIH